MINNTSDTNDSNDEIAELVDAANEAANEADTTAPAEKKTLFARFQSFLSGRKEKIAAKKVATADVRQINEFFGTIEAQLDKVDGQNKSLLEQLSMLKINNETLVSQVKILTQNNNQLTEQFNAMKKREKIAKILAIISAILAIGLSFFNIGRAFGWW